MSLKFKNIIRVGITAALSVAGFHFLVAGATPAVQPAVKITTVPGTPAVIDARNLYSETGAGHLSPQVKDDLERVYVPNLRSNDVSVIDPLTLKVVDRFKVGKAPQHIVPSWDLRTLWVANN